MGGTDSQGSDLLLILWFLLPQNKVHCTLSITGPGLQSRLRHFRTYVSSVASGCSADRLRPPHPPTVYCERSTFWDHELFVALTL